MNRRVQGGLCWITAAAVGVAVQRGLHLWLVKPSMTIPLLLTAAVLAVVGTLLLLTRERMPHDADRRASRMGWMFVIPFVLMPFAVVAPLGSWSAQRDSGSGVILAQGGVSYDPLPTGVTDLKLSQFWERAAYDDRNSLAGHRVRLVGFASPVDQGPGWALTRQAIVCCAADASAIKILPVGAAPVAADAWVRVEGEWIPPEPGSDRVHDMPRIRVASVTPISRPPAPYELAGDR